MRRGDIFTSLMSKDEAGVAELGIKICICAVKFRRHTRKASTAMQIERQMRFKPAQGEGGVKKVSVQECFCTCDT